MTVDAGFEDVIAGHVSAVSVRYDGATLTAAPSGTTLVVDDAGEFAQEGGALRVVDEDGNTEDATYVGVDFYAQTITLSAPLVGVFAAYDRVDVLDALTGDMVPVWYASVIDDLSGDDVTVPVHHTLIDKLGDGMRGLEGESVVARRDADHEWALTEIVGKAPVVDGTFIAPDTLPDPTIPTLPPAESPAVTVTGTAEGFILEAADVEPTTLIQYHVSTVEAFTPDATTAVGLPTRATVAYFTQGSEVTGGFMLEATYHWKTVASNIVGEAAPSAEASGSLNPEAVSEIVTARLVAGFILAGTIQVGQILIDADQGILIPQSDGTEIHLPADGSPATFSGKIVTNDLTVETNAVLNGLSHIVGELNLLTGIPNPSSAPDLAQVTLPSANSLPQGLDWAGLDYTSDGSIFFTCTTAYQEDATLYAVDADTGAVLHSADINGSTWVYGLTRRGNQIHVLLYNFNAHYLDLRTWDVDQVTGAFTFVRRGQVDLADTWNASHRPAIGADGTDLWIGYKDTSGNIQFDNINPVTATWISGPGFQLKNIGDEIKSISSFQFGTFDFGVKRLVLSSDTTYDGWFNPVWVFNAVGATPDIGFSQDAYRWPSATGGAIAWDGTRFVEKHRNSVDTLLFAERPTEVSRFFSYTWYDDNATNGTHESEASPVDNASVYAPRRFMKVICPTPPQGGENGDDVASKVRIYMGDTSDSTTHHLVTPGGLDDSTNYTAHFSDETIPGTDTPPTENEFAPLGQAGKITGGVFGTDPPIIELNGQGNGTLSGFSFVGHTWDLESDATDGSGPLIDLDSDGSWRLGDLNSDRLELEGTVTVSTSSNSSGSQVIVFDEEFATVPKIHVTGHAANFIPAVTARSTTGCTITIRHFQDVAVTASMDVDWEAKGDRA